MKIFIIIVFFALTIGVGYWLLADSRTAVSQPAIYTLAETDHPTQGNTNAAVTTINDDTITPPAGVNTDTVEPAPASPYMTPLDNPDERISKKPFGIYITPATSPVQPERFSGYHTGVDLEVSEAELGRPVAVRAFCEGSIVRRQTVSGYGGVVVQQCTVDGQTVTALYGHLNIDSVDHAVGDTLQPGDTIGLLGDDKSSQTDSERKHLHFSLHRGSAVDWRGYVSTEAELDGWLDPCDYICMP